MIISTCNCKDIGRVLSSDAYPLRALFNNALDLAHCQVLTGTLYSYQHSLIHQVVGTANIRNARDWHTWIGMRWTIRYSL